MDPKPLATVTIREIADAMRLAKFSGGLGRTIFLIGAGCSISAGIPGAAAIAQRMVLETAKSIGLGRLDDTPAAAYRSLVEASKLDTPPNIENIDWWAVYDELFDRHYKTPDDTRDLFARVLHDASSAINWAHLCLGELVQRGLVSTVLTTNFDQLVLRGMAIAGILPVVSDDIGSLNRLSGLPSHPQLIEIHGSRHTYRLRNSPEEVADMAKYPSAIGAIRHLVREARVIIVVGYGGREAGVMDLLVSASRDYPDKRIYWLSHGVDTRNISPRAIDFLSTSRNSAVLFGQDADRFFLELSRELTIGAPQY